MATKSFHFLSYDTARCHGKGCYKKEKCRRHTQIELDKEDMNAIRIAYCETLIDKDTNECTMRIEQ